MNDTRPDKNRSEATCSDRTAAATRGLLVPEETHTRRGAVYEVT
jgi:hypothetical protein